MLMNRFFRSLLSSMTLCTFMSWAVEIFRIRSSPTFSLTPWDGWWLLEASTKVPDTLQATIDQHKLWDEMVTKSVIC